MKVRAPQPNARVIRDSTMAPYKVSVAVAALPQSPRPKLPVDSKARKAMPMARGLLDYFPLALAEVAALSLADNEQHNPGEEMHWNRLLSTDHADCLVRHLVERGTLDTDGRLHSAKAAWRALAMLQVELEGNA